MADSKKRTIGFSLGGGNKKRKLPTVVKKVDDEKKESVKKDFITGMSGSKVESAESEESKAPLVIPMSVNPWSKDKEASGQNESEKENGEPDNNKKLTEDELAAQALMADLSEGGAPKSSGNLVIEVKKDKPSKDQPLLLASLPPGIMELENDDDRFAFDVKMRPEDMDVKSDVYKVVPIEEFGAAMLRGMGWTGPSKAETNLVNSAALVQPRHHRLGLGAQPKPPEEKKKRIKKQGEKDRDADARKLWAEKMKAANAEKRKQQKKSGTKVRLYKEDIVEVLEGEHKRTCAVVTQTDGVPGLNSIRLELEQTGEEVILSNKIVALVEDRDFAKKPFLYAPKKASEDKKTEFFGDKKKSDSSSSDKKDKDRRRDRDRDRDRRSSKDKRDKKDKKADREQRSSSSSSSKPNWVTSQIRVRVVSEKVGRGRFYGKKGVVQDVVTLGICDVRMDSGELLEEVKQSWLDTALPKPGGRVKAVGGAMRGQVGTLLERKKAQEQAVVQFESGCQVLSLDDVAEFLGVEE